MTSGSSRQAWLATRICIARVLLSQALGKQFTVERRSSAWVRCCSSPGALSFAGQPHLLFAIPICHTYADKPDSHAWLRESPGSGRRPSPLSTRDGHAIWPLASCTGRMLSIAAVARQCPFPRGRLIANAIWSHQKIHQQSDGSARLRRRNGASIRAVGTLRRLRSIDGATRMLAPASSSCWCWPYFLLLRYSKRRHGEGETSKQKSTTMATADHGPVTDHRESGFAHLRSRLCHFPIE